MTERTILLDVSRVVWRMWTGRLPTGIDRVCLAYIKHYGPKSVAVLQKGEFRIVLDDQSSDRLFALLCSGGQRFRTRFSALLARSGWHRRADNQARKIYLNIGHTGLDAPGLPVWLKQQRLRPVFMVHDLIPISHPEFCRVGEARRHAARIRNALHAAEGIIANSAATLEAVKSFASQAKLPFPEHSLVAFLGADEAVRPGQITTPQRPYFVVIGTIEARKNHLLLLRIWERMVADQGDDAPMLLLIGQRGWEADSVFAMLERSKLLEGNVSELGRCDDAQLTTLLHGARALLMPSFAEGFGIPVIEALQCGVPVIASNLPVYHEIAGAIPTYLDPLDESLWERAIGDFCGDCPERQRQLAAMQQFKAPGWTDHFAHVDAWLDNF